MSGYTIKNLKDVEDAAPTFGMSPALEARFAREELELILQASARAGLLSTAELLLARRALGLVEPREQSWAREHGPQPRAGDLGKWRGRPPAVITVVVHVTAIAADGRS